MKKLFKSLFCAHNYEKKRGNVNFFLEAKCCDYYMCKNCGKIIIK